MQHQIMLHGSVMQSLGERNYDSLYRISPHEACPKMDDDFGDTGDDGRFAVVSDDGCWTDSWRVMVARATLQWQ
jgi:hypothetical protein